LLVDTCRTVQRWLGSHPDHSRIYPFVFPVGTAAVLIYSLVKSFSPFPASPNNWSPVIVGAWMLAGVAVLVALRQRGGETWLHKAGEIVDDRTETAVGTEVIRGESTS
jgi:hypothetical protein